MFPCLIEQQKWNYVLNFNNFYLGFPHCIGFKLFMKSHSRNIFRTLNSSITGSDNQLWVFFGFFQEISSPNFPSNYPPNINCRWVLVAPSTSKIHLHFLSMNMEGSNLCSKDSLTIADASSKIPVRHEVNSSMIVSSDRNRNHANRWFRVSFVKSFWNLVWISFIFLYLPFFSFLRCSFFAFSYSYWFSFSLSNLFSFYQETNLWCFF